MGLHNILDNALSSISEENTLVSWSIWHDKNGDISVRIRYKAAEETSNRDEQVHYRKKSARQVLRDQDRGRARKANQRVINAQQRSECDAVSVRQTTPPPAPGAISAYVVLDQIQTRSRVKQSLADAPESFRYEASSVTDCAFDSLLVSPCVSSTPDTGSLLSIDSDATTPDVNTIMTPHLTTSTSHLVDSPLNETYTLPVTEQQTKLAIHLNMSRDSSPEKPPDTPPHQIMLSDVTSPELIISPVEDSSQSEQLDKDDLINMLRDVIRETMTSLNV